jgi:spore maturation protein CgeB
MEAHVVESLNGLGCPTEFATTRIAIPASLPGGALLRKAAEFALREPERLAEPRLLRLCASFAPDLVLVLLGSQLSPKTIERMRGVIQAPIVCWCQDQMTTLGRQYLIGADYDAVFLKDRYLQDLFSRMVNRDRYHYLAEACNPRVHRPIALTDAERQHYACDVTIAGNLYYYRQQILRRLDAFDVKIWGNSPDWLMSRLRGRHMGRAVFGDDKARAVRAARVALNTLHFGEVDGLNCRAFELAGCGAFQLITSKPVVAEHFTPGVEIATFESVDDLVDKIRYYIDRPAVTAEIARRGQARAHREHTYEHRLREIFRIVFGSHHVGSATAATVRSE